MYPRCLGVRHGRQVAGGGAAQPSPLHAGRCAPSPAVHVQPCGDGASTSGRGVLHGGPGPWSGSSLHWSTRLPDRHGWRLCSGTVRADQDTAAAAAGAAAMPAATTSGGGGAGGHEAGAAPASSQGSSSEGRSAAAPTTAAGGGGEAGAAPAAGGAAPEPTYSPLHYNVEAFVTRVQPTPAEIQAKQRTIEAVRACTRKAFENARRVVVQPFGSHVSGLSTWASDVDLVVVGLVEPNRITGGFGQGDKQYVLRCLSDIAKQLRRYRKLQLDKLIVIRTARMPIIKFSTGDNITVDISVGDDTGPRAARYCAQQLRAYPPLRPLVLVLKTYLRSCGLNEVSGGGLSSFALTNMVLAHLMEELRAGRDIYDLGECLYSFLLRYGDEFDYGRDAVSVASGGIVSKADLAFAAESTKWENGAGGSGGRWEERLCVDDPLTGRDVSAGSYRILDVQLAFSKAARRLEALARGRRPSDTRPNYLEGLFDVQRAVRREYSDDYYSVVQRPARGGGRGGGGGGGGGRGRGGGAPAVWFDSAGEQAVDLSGSSEALDDLLEEWDPLPPGSSTNGSGARGSSSGGDEEEGDEEGELGWPEGGGGGKRGKQRKGKRR